MKNTFGGSVSVTLFGESHGAMIGAVLDGLAPGIVIDKDFINERLDLRKPKGRISTARHEADEFKIVSGVFEGRTTGTPICIVIENSNTRSGDYNKSIARPSHADFTAHEKYHGFEDYRGGGHFSGRITAPLVAAGAIAASALESNGIYVGTHILKCCGISDRNFESITEDIKELNKKYFPVLDGGKAAEINSEIEKIAADGDSVGGILQTAVTGMPTGVGEPWFDTVESCLSHIIFSVPAVKGIEFGAGFGFADMKGSEANDPFYTDGKHIYTMTNNNGGINGGITNGMPIMFNTVIKPTPSIYKEQDTVDFEKTENTKLKIDGRHDPAIIHRARTVIDSVTALCLCDLLSQRFGTDFLGQPK